MYTKPAPRQGITAEMVAALSDLVQELRSEQVRGYRLKTVAGLLDVSYDTVDKLVRDGRLGHVWAGAQRLVPHEELRRFLASGVLETPAA